MTMLDSRVEWIADGGDTTGAGLLQFWGGSHRSISISCLYIYITLYSCLYCLFAPCARPLRLHLCGHKCKRTNVNECKSKRVELSSYSELSSTVTLQS